MCPKPCSDSDWYNFAILGSLCCLSKSPRWHVEPRTMAMAKIQRLSLNVSFVILTTYVMKVNLYDGGATTVECFMDI